ncbi:MAG: thermostable hemolysin [Gammaproteobacteria bacterium]
MSFSRPQPSSPEGEKGTTPLGELAFISPGDAGRSGIEQFIAGVYARRFGARVRQFAPHLAGLRDPHSGAWIAAAGYRPADESPLFLERYLPAPIEDILSQHRGRPVTRRGIVEVAHLSADQPGAGRLLIPLLGQHLARESAQWVVSTLTQELRHLFVRMGVTPIALGQADRAAVGPDAADWGTYYEHHPVVLAGRLDAALRLMRQKTRTPHLPRSIAA